MKEIIFLGNTLECLQGFPDNIRQRAGYELYQVQCGEMPSEILSQWQLLAVVL